MTRIRVKHQGAGGGLKKESANHIRFGIWSSFLMVAATSIVAVIVAYCFGIISPTLPLSWPKLLGLVGGFLVGWATLMELGGFIETYSGEALHELLHPALFRVLFLPGTFAGMLGFLW
jgi:hypothetical protein